MNRVKYYESYDEDFIESQNQNYQLKSNYQWLHHNVIYLLVSYLFYYLVLIVSFVYGKFYLRVSIKNKKILRHCKNYYIYSNHTQMLGDVFDPFLVNFPKRPYIICSPANLGIPIIGKLLPLGGALPIPGRLRAMKQFIESIHYHNSKNHPIVIYPEGHLWPWCSQIREFSKTSFHFPVDTHSPAFVSTTTYQKSKFFKHPKITIYIDGPYYPQDNLTKDENIQYLHDKVYETMKERSQSSNYSYIVYKKKGMDEDE
ncbi:MAG: 1-acyl-sn-glycerol-3-phosphate acyltransferase [Erysipelotrichaceae bacterium]|nr:1-acyl-sn-glycerol-3-phosphate acyltransferase [Erysipelotrichaceae bacterium]